MLSLREMLKLYRLVGKHIPDVENPDDLDIIEFIGTIIDNMVLAGQLTNYADAVLLTSHKNIDDIKDLPTTEIIKLFAEGLAENNVFAFKEFLEKVNFNV